MAAVLAAVNSAPNPKAKTSITCNKIKEVVIKVVPKKPVKNPNEKFSGNHVGSGFRVLWFGSVIGVTRLVQPKRFGAVL